MNYAEVAVREPLCSAAPLFDVPEGFVKSVEKNAIDVATGCGEALSARLDGGEDGKVVFRVDGRPENPLRADYRFEAAKHTASRVEIDAAPHSEATVIVFYEADENADGSAAVQTVIKTGEGARIHLVQVVKVGRGFTFLNDVGIRQDAAARVEVTQLYLGGGSVYGGLRSDLAGYRSDFQNRIGYLLGQDETLDLNVISSHGGKKSNCDIMVRGVLSDNAQKVFRGTIDFLNGSSGSTGTEKEEVLLMNEAVVNKTIPLILCAEEDVEGSHGASIGRLDENAVFYMMTRGMSPEQIDQLMAKAKIWSVMNHIGDVAAKDRIWKMLGGEAHVG